MIKMINSVLILMVQVSFTQNTFPVLGDVGIGTESPSEALEVVGNIKADIGFFGTNLPDEDYELLPEDRNKKYRVFTAGKQFSDSEGLFNIFQFPKSTFASKPVSWISLEDSNWTSRWRFSATAGGVSELMYFDKNQSPVFGFLQTDTEIKMHLSKPNSLFVIGETLWDNSLANGYKFIVRDGAALIEGAIETNDKIGVGVAASEIGEGYDLGVVNGVIAGKFRIQSQEDWPDYVFANNYEVPGLDEVAKHIKDYGRLPQLPRAEIVKNEGYELGTMDAKLLLKIEELTLYVIQQQKEIEWLKEQMQHK